LAGWIFDVHLLKALSPGVITVKANTAVGFILAGVSLWLCHGAAAVKKERRSLLLLGHRLCAALLTTIGVLTLVEYVFGWNLGIDQWLFHEWTPDGVNLPGRMGATTAFVFALLGLSLLAIDSSKRPRFSQSCAVFAALVAFVAFVSSLYGFHAFYGFGHVGSMALSTSISVMLLGLATLALRPEYGLAAAFLADTSSGVLARRVMGPAFIGPVLIGRLLLAGAHAGFYSPELTPILMAVFSAILLTLLLWFGMAAVNRMDCERQRLDQQLKSQVIALRASQEALYNAHQQATTALLEQISDGFVTVDRDWRCLCVNSAAARILRKPPEDLLGKVLWDVFPETDRLLFGKEYRRAMAENVAVTVEDFYPEPLNAWFEMRCYPSTDGLSVFFSDITKRKQMYVALQESEQRFRSVVEQAGDGFELLDEEGRFLDMNRATCQQLGYTREELLRMRVPDIDPLVNWEQSKATFPSLETKPRRFESVHVRKDGTPFPVEVTASIIRMGDTQRMVSQVRDITERKATEQRIRQLSRAVEQSPSSVVITDTKGNIEYINPKFTELTGYTSDEVYGKNPRILKSGACALDIYKEMWKTICAGREWRGEFYNKKKNGEFFWESASICPIIDENGVITHFLGLKEDITERKNAELALLEAKHVAERANQAKDDFIAALSHELRTPLTPVLLTASALQDEETLSPDLRSQISLIRHNVQMEARLVDDLLDVSKIAHGKISLQPEGVDVSALLSKALEMMDEDIVCKGLAIQIEADADHVTAYGDPARLQQVFWNLLKNAAKFTPSGGSIHVRTFNPDLLTLCVEFRDTGVGIAPEFLDEIFHPFEQGAVSGNYRYGGLGLGLSISNAIVKLHGGTLSVASEGLNRGATFTVSLPVSKTAQPAQPPSNLTPVKNATLFHILLVEDDDNTRMVLARLLTRDGHQVEAVGTCAAAIQSAKATATAKPNRLRLSSAILACQMAVDSILLAKSKRSLLKSKPSRSADTARRWTFLKAITPDSTPTLPSLFRSRNSGALWRREPVGFPADRRSSA
jgi:PAS domain S-box-containing protein